jgi:dolichol kinase
VGVDYDYIIRAAYLYELNIKEFFVANVTPKVTSMFSREVESQETYGYYIYIILSVIIYMFF